MERIFDENAIPKTIVPVDVKKIKEQESLIAQNAQQIETLYLEIEKLSKLLSASKFEHIVTRSLPKVPETEAETRRYIIDVDLKLMGWEFEGPNKNVFEEFKAVSYTHLVKKCMSEEEKSELSTICRQLKLKAPDGKMRLTDVADMQGIFRIIQSVPSPKACLLYTSSGRWYK